MFSYVGPAALSVVTVMTLIGSPVGAAAVPSAVLDAVDSALDSAVASVDDAGASVVGAVVASAVALFSASLLAACGDDEDSDSATGGKVGTGGRPGSGGTASTNAGSNGLGGAASGGDGGDDEGGKTGGAAGDTSVAGQAGASATGGELDADVQPLNALMTAEYNAITAYTAGAGLIDAAPDTDPLFDLKDVVLQVAVNIQSQHRLHAAALVDAIATLGGNAVEEAAVASAFSPPAMLVDNPTISNVLKFAAAAERGAAVAYNQVLAGLEDARLRFLATSIEGDETQHFIVLAALVLGLAAPGPNLDTDSADEVLPAAFVARVGTVDGLDAVPPDYFP